MTDSNQRRGVAITGIGAISNAGDDAERLWQAALAQSVSAGWLEQTVAGRPIAACRAPQPSVGGLRDRDFRRLDRFAQLGVAAGQHAWADAAIDTETVDPRRIAVISGTSRGPFSTRHRELSSRRVRPTAAVYSSISSLTGTLAALVGARGPSQTVSATCASSAVALSMAAMQIESGACDVALVGGADAPLHPNLLEEMRATGVLGFNDDPRLTCRPFDRRRTGIIIGEGAAFLVLESLFSATARGARIRALLTGWSSNCDAGHRSGMSDDARGVRESLEGALSQAECQPADVDAIHLHGTGTHINDLAEARIVRELFGDRTDELPCTSTKPITGHCLGASGALQSVINVRALEEQVLPPTANCEDLDPECRIALVRQPVGQIPCRRPIDSILTHSAGFWGNHAGLLFRRA